MRRVLLLVPVPVLLLVAVLSSDDGGLKEGKYRKLAPPKRLEQWDRDYATKRGLVPPPPPPPTSDEPAVDFSGTFRFGPWNYDIVVSQDGDQVTFRSGGVDRQDIGGAWETIGAGVVRNGRIHARWWCIDLSRNYANNGGAEMWFFEGDRNRLYVRYYHDADEKIEEGYGVRAGTYAGERQHYRIRIKQPTRKLRAPLVLQGTVTGRDGETLPDAVVMLRHEEQSAVRTDEEGRWSIAVNELDAVVMVAAAKPGYITQVEAILLHRPRELHFRLEPSPYGDDPRYEFVRPAPSKQRAIWNCGNCHKNSYEEWKGSRHALAARNAVTRAVYERDFLPALAAGRAQGDAGLCAACHAPQAALDGNTARLDEVEGVALYGNHCDFCHKVHHTEDVERPGVRGSLQLGRPAPDDPRVPGPIKRVYGSLADTDYVFMGPVYNPFFATGLLCAGCHQYTTPRGVPALDTHAEWRAWAREREQAESCQGCHMPTGLSMEGKRLARRICINALRRPQEQIHDHSFRGRELATNAVRLAVSARVEGGKTIVESTVVAYDVGHKVPTGSGDKHLLLVVVPEDEVGLVEGPRVPHHAGGDPAQSRAERLAAHDFAGLPGREFAQVLADADGNSHVPFWRAVRLVEDTRLEPDKPVRVRHVFARPVAVTVQLWHRLRFKRHDPAAGVAGAGARPLDLLLMTQSVRPR